MKEFDDSEITRRMAALHEENKCSPRLKCSCCPDMFNCMPEANIRVMLK